MSTALYFLSAAADWSRGEGDQDLQGNTRNWLPLALSTTRGGALATGTRTSVTGATAGLEVWNGASQVLEWLSPPLAQDVTISGNVSFNLWGLESSMSANAGLGCIIERLNSEGAIVSTVLDNPEVGAELGTSAAVRNESSAPTSTNMLKGDRFRVRVYFNDAAGTTMASGFTLTFGYNGDQAATNGDSFVTFSEDILFLVKAPGASLGASPTAGGLAFGAASNERRAQCFVMPSNGTITSISLKVWKSGSPTDNVNVSVQADSGGEPSGTDLATGSRTAASLTNTSETVEAFDISDVALLGGQKYWIVVARSGAADAANNYFLGVSVLTPQHDGFYSSFNGTSWSATRARFAYWSGAVSYDYSSIYLTNANPGIDPNGGSYDPKEAWTSRGSGVVTMVTNDTVGPTDPILAMDVGGFGGFIEWFTKPLTAFTLSGLVYCNVRARETNAGSNAAMRAQIAVCDGDGTNPVVWGATTDDVELGTSEAALTWVVAGDDTAITNGQRLRIRIYFDDAPALAMANAGNLELAFAGTSGGASGDTYLDLPQTITEFVSGPALPFMAMARTRT